MSNSSLVDVTILSPNHSGKRTSAITRITPHCVVGQVSAEWLGNYFKDVSVQASCNYGIDKDGRVLLCVEESNRSWCSSSYDNDQKAVTIECASDMKEPYTMNTAVYNKLIDLCVDICKRNGIKTLLWLGNKENTLAYNVKSGECVLTAHRWFANKSCPGDWLYSRFGKIAETVNERLNTNANNKSLYRVTVDGYNTKDKASKTLSDVKASGVAPDSFIRQDGDNYTVQCGAYSIRANAVELSEKLQKFGFIVYINGIKQNEDNKKSNEEVAIEVIKGLWGNGDDREKRLTAAGYDYKAVQQLVNKMWLY